MVSSAGCWEAQPVPAVVGYSPADGSVLQDFSCHKFYFLLEFFVLKWSVRYRVTGFQVCSSSLLRWPCLL